MYRVIAPKYVSTERRYIGKDFPEGERIWRVVGWIELGTAQDMAEALRKFPRGRGNGYSPILEQIDQLH